MALTFSEKLRTHYGNKMFVISEVTHDGSTTTINASDIGLNYIDYALLRNKSGATAVGDSLLSGNAYGTYIALANVLSAADVDILEAWGY